MQGNRAFLLLNFFESQDMMALFYVLQKISIPNYPAKFFHLMTFVNFNVDSYLLWG